MEDRRLEGGAGMLLYNWNSVLELSVGDKEP
jgi:hypothetical protein